MRRYGRGIRAIVSAAASACWVARPPCLIGSVVASPAAKTCGTPSTRALALVSMKPSESAGRPSMNGPRMRGSAMTASAASMRPSVVTRVFATHSAAFVRPMNSTPARSSSRARASEAIGELAVAQDQQAVGARRGAGGPARRRGKFGSVVRRAVTSGCP